MEVDDSGIDSDPKNHLEFKLNKPHEPIITFSPDRCRFSEGKSRNSSIASDFDLNMQRALNTNSTASNEESEIQTHPGHSITSALNDLLSTSSNAEVVESTAFSNNNKNHNVVSHSGESTEPRRVNDSDGSDRSQHGMKNGTTTSQSNHANSINGGSSSSLQLQKKLEKQIAQASAIQASLTSTTKEENEFGDWSSNTTTSTTITSTPLINNTSTSSSNSTTQEFSVQKNSKDNSAVGNTEIPSQSQCLQDVEGDFRKLNAVKFQENEVEFISKSSRRVSGSGFDARKMPGGLIPPERLAVPNKGLSHSNRKHSSSKSESLTISVINAPNQPISDNHIGSTSEIKPLVQWDSDESEDELSFFPSGKTRGKLTDNLSIDNMSLSGEEDDLHLSPPRLTQKCPCDPRHWINEHIPKSHSFSRQNGQCTIS